MKGSLECRDHANGFERRPFLKINARLAKRALKVRCSERTAGLMNVSRPVKRTTMTTKSKAMTTEPVARCPPPQELEKHNPQLKHLAGSNYDDWNTLVANQVMQSGWYPSKMDDEQRQKMHFGFLCFMSGVEPKDELEGMLASQLLASHNAAMEGYRRAMLPEQTFEGRRENLSQANKLSRTHATLLEALNRHRGKGQQKVTVEHVHVHSGGQAVVGMVETPGGGDSFEIGGTTPRTANCICT